MVTPPEDLYGLPMRMDKASVFNRMVEKLLENGWLLDGPPVASKVVMDAAFACVIVPETKEK